MLDYQLPWPYSITEFLSNIEKAIGGLLIRFAIHADMRIYISQYVCLQPYPPDFEGTHSKAGA